MCEPNALASGFFGQNGRPEPAASAVGSVYASGLSDHERRKALEVIDLFHEDETRDELGIGSVRDASADRAPGASELVPYWIHPVDGGAKIQRFVPAMPLSQEFDRLASMRNALAVYRMVFGQPRQDDLVAYLLQRVSQERLTKELDEFRIDLTPPPHCRTQAGTLSEAFGKSCD